MNVAYNRARGLCGLSELSGGCMDLLLSEFIGRDHLRWMGSVAEFNLTVRRTEGVTAARTLVEVGIAREFSLNS